MVLSDGTVKVMDFGIAKVIEALNQTNTQSVGTLQYMSPEQIDAHTIDHRSDLYCLGLIFYEMLAGGPPFHSASPRQLLNLQCTAEPPPLPDGVRTGLPRGVEQVLFQLLEKAPEDRPYLAEDIIERLERFRPLGRAPSRCLRKGRRNPNHAPSNSTGDKNTSETAETAHAAGDGQHPAPTAGSKEVPPTREPFLPQASLSRSQRRRRRQCRAGQAIVRITARGHARRHHRTGRSCRNEARDPHQGRRRHRRGFVTARWPGGLCREGLGIEPRHALDDRDSISG